MMIDIRHAERKDLDEIMRIYQAAKIFMRQNGNHSQWPDDSYPSREVLNRDIEKSECFVCEKDGSVKGVFVLMHDPDPNYQVIEGAWPNDDPYISIHRIASDQSTKGVFGICIEYAKSKGLALRIDTHADNSVMQHLIVKHGFEYCGIIYVSDGTPRLAYSYNA